MSVLPEAFPQEFHDDVVAVARKGEAPVAQIAKDFAVSESSLHRWLQQADIDVGNRPGVRRVGVSGAAGTEEAQPSARAGERGAPPGDGLPGS